MATKGASSKHSKALLLCGGLSVLSCLVVFAANLMGMVLVDEHNPISETISALAVGEFAWVIDAALILYAAGLAALAAGLYAWNLGKIRWKVGTLAVGLVAIAIIVIAVFNEYAGAANAGANIHRKSVYALGLLFPLATLLLAVGLGKVDPIWYRYSLSTCLVWIIFAPLFFYIPTNFDGAYERFIASIMVAWFFIVSFQLLKRGLEKGST